MGPLPDGRSSVLKPPGSGISLGVVTGLEAPVLGGRDWVGRRTIERGLLMGPLPDGRDSVLRPSYAVRSKLRRWHRLTPNRGLLMIWRSAGARCPGAARPGLDRTTDHREEPDYGSAS